MKISAGNTIMIIWGPHLGRLTGSTRILLMNSKTMFIEIKVEFTMIRTPQGPAGERRVMTSLNK